MLCQFTFCNFKSFKEEAFLDLCAENISEHKDSLIVDKDKEKFLPLISIYGPNGGGKSNVLEALLFLRLKLIIPALAINKSYSVSDSDKKNLSNSIEEYGKEKYHKFDEACAREPISFEVRFRNMGREYLYEISILGNVIAQENLYYREIGGNDVIMIFERSSESCAVGEEIAFIPIDKVRTNLPLLTYIASTYDVASVNDALDWFMSIEYLDYDNPITDKKMLIPKKDVYREQFFSILKSMDINISDLRIEEDDEEKIKDIYCKHLVDGKEYELRIEEESSGTRKIFSCLARIINCLKDGRLLVADELDAKLHPKLLKFIIELFTNPKTNNKGAQLIITSHDIINMNPDVLRRDEIWFCALSAQNSSKLYSLIQFKSQSGKLTRKDAIYGKQYLEGRYGADPYISKGLSWGE